MPEAGSSVRIQTSIDPIGYIIVVCSIPGKDLRFLLNTGRPLSYLSVDAQERLLDLGYCTEIGGGIFRVRGLPTGDQVLPDFFAKVSIGPGVMGFDGFIGLQFLDQFRRITFERQSRLLTLDS